MSLSSVIINAIIIIISVELQLHKTIPTFSIGENKPEWSLEMKELGETLIKV